MGGHGKTGALTFGPLLGVAAVVAVMVLTPTLAGAYTFPKGEQGRVAFTATGAGGQYDVFAMNRDGTGATNLTNTPTVGEVDPAFSPTGSRIYFSRGDGAQIDIWAMNADGSAQVNLTNTPALDESRLSPSPDGTKLAFARGSGGQDDLYEAQIDRFTGAFLGAPRPLAATPGDVHDIDPSYTPDGRSIYYGQGSVTSALIVRLDATTGAVLDSDVTSPPANMGDIYPAVSPDGQSLLFTRIDGGTGNFDVYSARIDGSGARNLTNTPVAVANELLPRFFADGSRIAFTRLTGGGMDFRLFSMAPDGSGAAPLSATPIPDEFDADMESIFSCAGRRATIVGSDGPDKLKGTKRADVIVANGGKDTVKGKGGNDRICGGAGKDTLNGGAAKDTLLGQGGKDKLKGGGAKDICKGGKGNDSASCEVEKSV